MPISHKYNAIFVHIPKTGGTTIEHYLEIPKVPSTLWRDRDDIRVIYNRTKYCLQHLPAKFIKDMYPYIFDRYYKFSFVRNPYERVISEYAWRHGMHPEFKLDINSYEYFSDWIRKFYKGNQLDHNCSQRNFLYHKNILLVDKVYRFEEFEKSIDELKTKFSIENKEIKTFNKTEMVLDKDKLLSLENKNFIYQKFKIDFDTFDYQK
jgi:hypothetical protein